MIRFQHPAAYISTLDTVQFVQDTTSTRVGQSTIPSLCAMLTVFQAVDLMPGWCGSPDLTAT